VRRKRFQRELTKSNSDLQRLWKWKFTSEQSWSQLNLWIDQSWSLLAPKSCEHWMRTSRLLRKISDISWRAVVNSRGANSILPVSQVLWLFISNYLTIDPQFQKSCRDKFLVKLSP
jgi:hypothetical protein